MSRVSLKIVGASGQGIDSVGEIVARALKRSGFCVFGYREYPSLIKGGHASYQLDWSNEHIESSETKVNIVIALNHHGLERNIPDLKPGGILIHNTPQWTFPKEHQTLIERLSLSVIEFPMAEILKKLQAKPIMANVVLSAFVWAILGQDIESMKKMVGERFAKKKDLLEINMRCIEEGYGLRGKFPNLTVTLPKPDKKWRDRLLLTGSKAVGLGAVHAGVRLYAGYPMTPSSPLLSYIAEIQNKTGMVVKQAEDEITAAQFVSGAMFAGTRALTATAGGGFDLMSETLSMNGIIENPTVFVVAQRPGPGTGLPTWTAQADLLMTVNTAHGEFPRCVLSLADSQDSFELMGEAFNIAEKYQISVIVLIDKHLGEALYTQKPYDQKQGTIDRGLLVTNPEKLKKLASTDRYDPNAKDGISVRWLPGSKAAVYDAQADEHDGEGASVETAENAAAQMTKRMRKLEALRRDLPEPTFWTMNNEQLTMNNEDFADVLLVGWGSTKSVILDILKNSQLTTHNSQLTIGYLHYTYLWPLKTERFSSLAKRAKKVILIEGNAQGQLGMLLRQQTGIDIERRILKADGRPFFVDELSEAIRLKLEA
jgi:2-oxoglutarate ferredoxin oxidoreductase subunit alpha